MNLQQTCDPDRLSAFVRGELSEDQESELTAHLDQCVACGEELERRVAAAEQWREASELLTDRARRSNMVDLANDPSTSGGFTTSTTFAEQMDHVVGMLAPTDDPEMLGRIGGYEVSGVIGCGGMGVVFKAHDRSLDRVVAIKVMAPHLAGSGAARKRFARESKAAAAVLHPNVIAIHCVADDPKLPYLVMPYIGGASLQKRVEADGPLCTQDTLRIGQQIAAGLAAAHAQGLVHRDIKPANILLERGVERVTITDFGLARAVDDATMTRSGVIAGTPQYMSPEQARGESIDHRSDLFSLGSVLYMMCGGHSPFRAETTFGILRRITDNQPRPLREINPDVPEWLCAIIEKLHAKEPSERFQSAEEVGELLEGCLAHVQQPSAIPLRAGVQALAAQSQSSSTESLQANRLKAIHQRKSPIGQLVDAAAIALSQILSDTLNPETKTRMNQTRKVAILSALFRRSAKTKKLKWIIAVYAGVGLFVALSNLSATTTATKMPTASLKGESIPPAYLASLSAVKDNGGVVPNDIKNADVMSYVLEMHRGWPQRIQDNCGYQYYISNPATGFSSMLSGYPNYSGIHWSKLAFNFTGAFAITIVLHLSLTLLVRGLRRGSAVLDPAQISG